jgi:hypothetical protein
MKYCDDNKRRKMIVVSAQMALLFALVFYAGYCVATEDSSTLKSVCIPVFDGKYKSFHGWWVKFLAYCAAVKLAATMKKAPEAHLPAKEEPQAGETDKNRAARDRNLKSMYAFTPAFQTEGLMNMIHGTRTDDWPAGLAWKVVNALFAKYRPSDEISCVESRLELMKAMMNVKDDPSVFFECLLTIKNKYKDSPGAIADADLIAHTLTCAPVAYRQIIGAELRAQELRGDALSLDGLEHVLHQYWCYGARAEAAKGKEDFNHEVNFVAGGTETRTCWKCQKKGHIMRDCPGEGKKKNNGNNSSKFCMTCKKKGHEAETCWMDLKNAHKVPKWAKNMIEKKMKKNTEVGAPAVDDGDDSDYEVLMVIPMGARTIKKQLFPDDLKLLMAMDIRLCDTCATMDMTRYLEGFFNLHKALESKRAKCANGQDTGAEQVGSLRMTVCDNQGGKLHRIRADDVAYVPKCPYNVLSATKRQKQHQGANSSARSCDRLFFLLAVHFWCTHPLLRP